MMKNTLKQTYFTMWYNIFCIYVLVVHFETCPHFLMWWYLVSIPCLQNKHISCLVFNVYHLTMWDKTILGSIARNRIFFENIHIFTFIMLGPTMDIKFSCPCSSSSERKDTVSFYKIIYRPVNILKNAFIFSYMKGHPMDMYIWWKILYNKPVLRCGITIKKFI